DKSKDAALLVAGNPKMISPTRNLVVKDCRFEGPFQGAVVIDGRTEKCTFTHNRFFQNAIGFQYKTSSPRHSVQLTIDGNTFCQLTHAFYLEDGLNYIDPNSLTIQNNLFSRCNGLASLRFDPPKKQPDNSAGKWIWFPDSGEPHKSAPSGKRYFRKSFRLPNKPITSSPLDIGADDKFTVWVNGALVGSSGINRVLTYNVKPHLKEGNNVIAVECENSAGPAGLIAELDCQFTGNPQIKVGSDASWKTSNSETAGWQGTGFDDNSWSPARELGTHKAGHVPWKGWWWDAAVWSTSPKELKELMKTANNVRDPYSAEGTLNLHTIIIDFPALPADPGKPDFLLYPASGPLGQHTPKVGVPPQ
ncbi:MAG: beta galactosidase jelly roll domain-containing protein, partial [Gemmataceae bacterium]